MSTPITVIRHPKEKLSKCSLEPLRGRPDIEFFKAHDDFTFDATGYLLLAIDAPEISRADAGKPLLLLDSTWRLLPQLMCKVHGEPIRRTLPMHVRTAYPRVSKIAEDPARGLASVEALYLAKKLLGEDDPSLLDHYYWRNDFLRQFG
ncbi:hypothetical protein [Cerasicoccus fimbriatus]|uniref:hypothetical protein n=1 Tax=Cerasicoccus fimbriatus TaxID=3014554 RepID=UPI0022B4C72B|nr:hypothetical protein [Cerasicoccus sp. TK19100]